MTTGQIEDVFETITQYGREANLGTATRAHGELRWKVRSVRSFFGQEKAFSEVSAAIGESAFTCYAGMVEVKIHASLIVNRGQLKRPECFFMDFFLKTPEQKEKIVEALRRAKAHAETLGTADSLKKIRAEDRIVVKALRKRGLL